MRALLHLLLAASCVLADKNDNRRNKLPFVADAVGNSLPPPSNVPATVGSPVNLLNPDRYEFYTFDESGELVKRLMTLEEIQAIVAAGEEAEGLVTFANDNQPTVSFNINQPPYTKVHSVVTNVQNVLKAQMEAHKNKPLIQPTLDTPDVSDSWSLILPSIFGNTGVDIVLDKATGSVTTPETETLDHDEFDENSLSKEGSNQIITNATTVTEEKPVIAEKMPVEAATKEVTTTSSSTTTTSTTTTTTTPKPTTTTRKITTTTSKPTTTTRKVTTTTTAKPTTTTRKRTTTTTPKPITTTRKITTTTTPKPTTTTEKPTTTRRPATTTRKATTASNSPSTTTTTVTTTTTKKSVPSSTTTKRPVTNASTKNIPTTTTTSKPITKTTEKITTTAKPETTTKKLSVSVLPSQEPEITKVQVQPNFNAGSNDEKSEIQFEKISTFIPVSTVEYITEGTTRKPVTTNQPSTVQMTTTKRSVSTPINTPTLTEQVKIQVTTDKPVISTSSYISTTQKYEENDNVTTITTQSVSPSTAVSSTEFVSADNDNNEGINPNVNENDKVGEPLIPMFDVAQSISQIASDLGGSYQPIPTTSNLLDTTNEDGLDLESKEVLDMDIPSGAGNNTEEKLSEATDKNSDNFVKISTIDPHNKNKEDNNKKNGNSNKSNNDSNENAVKDTNDKKESENDASIKVSTVQKTETKSSSSTENKNNNIIVNNIQKVELMTTTVSTEATTMDPFLSESMGDLLSQVVNEAPQSIGESNKRIEEDKKATTTEKAVALTTTENSQNVETISEVSNKVKKETSSTTVTPVAETTENIELKENTGNQNSSNASSKMKNNDEKTVIQDKKTIEPSTEVKKNENENIQNKEKGTNFVQISVSTNKQSDLKSQIASTEKEKNEKVPNDNKDSVKDFVDKDKAKNGNKTNEVRNTEMDNVSKVPLDLDMSTATAAPNKISQSVMNKIKVGEKTNTVNKKDKLPEALPKVDDFKKKIQKVNLEEEELISERNNSWKLIPTLSPPKANEIPKDKVKSENHYIPDISNDKDIVLEFSNENQGLEVTTKDLGEDIARFSELANELAFRFWNVMIDDIDKKRSFVLSPYSIFSMLAMIFMGARGATSGEMNEILKLDDMVTFNPHFTLKNISDSIETTPESGVAVSAFIRELYSDRNKGKILTFYKERAQHFYNGHVEEINFKLISDIIRRRTNLLVKRYTWGKMPEYMKTNNIIMQPPLAAFTVNVFETDCSGTSVEGRDGEMYFVVSPNVRQRRLVPVPAVVYKRGFLAGYDPVLDATAAALGNTNTIVSTLFLMPGQQGNVVHADDLEKLEQRLLEALPTTPTWNRVLRTLLPRTGLELQIPRFSHKSTFNVSSALRKMGLKDLFDGEHADLGGLNGPSKDLYLSDMVQLNTLTTCGEGVVGEQHHIEEYPETLSVSQRRRARWLNDWDEPRDYQRAFHDPHDVGDAMHLPLHLRPRQARLPARSAQPARLKFDRPFLYFVRHNPSGMILYFGRYNPRLLP